MEGFPLPRLASLLPVHWGYIDDYGVGVLEQPKKSWDEMLIGRIQKAVEALLRDVGLQVHKVEFGEGLPLSLGVTIIPGTWVCRLPDEKLKGWCWLLDTFWCLGLAPHAAVSTRPMAHPGATML